MRWLIWMCATGLAVLAIETRAAAQPLAMLSDVSSASTGVSVETAPWTDPGRRLDQLLQQNELMASVTVTTECPGLVYYVEGVGFMVSCPPADCTLPSGAGTGECTKILRILDAADNEFIEYCACKKVGDPTAPQPSACHVFLYSQGGVTVVNCNVDGVCPGSQVCPTFPIYTPNSPPGTGGVTKCPCQ